MGVKYCQPEHLSQWKFCDNGENGWVLWQSNRWCQHRWHFFIQDSRSPEMWPSIWWYCQEHVLLLQGDKSRTIQTNPLISYCRVWKVEIGLTFINAFESSPIHWWKSWPSGNQCRPGNGGTVDILPWRNQHLSQTTSNDDLPVVYIINDFLCSSFPVCQDQVFIDPSYYVVLECTLDHLMW